MTVKPTKLHPAAAEPCSACPWLTANHGKPHPDQWYTDANRRRLWGGLRNGERMTCHPTDPTNPLPEGQAPPPATAKTRECTGALVLQQREAQRFQWACEAAERDQGRDGLKRYRRANPKGMTRPGILRVIERFFFGGTPLGGEKMPKLDLNLPVSHADLVPREMK